jgi:hypothetical protein
VPATAGLCRLAPFDFTAKQREKLDSYFGSSEWYGAVYREDPGLFGESNTTKLERSGKALAKWYRERLKTVYPFGSRPALNPNTRGGHLYYLMLATPKKAGLNIADYILSAGENM